jgi:hypothetical protein
MGLTLIVSPTGLLGLLAAARDYTMQSRVQPLVARVLQLLQDTVEVSGVLSGSQIAASPNARGVFIFRAGAGRVEFRCQTLLPLRFRTWLSPGTRREPGARGQ